MFSGLDHITTTHEYKPGHYLVPVDHELQPAPVLLGTESREQAFGGDPARTATENIDVVDAKVKGLAMSVFDLNQFAAAKARLLLV